MRFRAACQHAGVSHLVHICCCALRIKLIKALTVVGDVPGHLQATDVGLSVRATLIQACMHMLKIEHALYSRDGVCLWEDSAVQGE